MIRYNGNNSKDIKIAIINVYHVSKKVLIEEIRTWWLEKGIYKKKTQIEILQMEEYNIWNEKLDGITKRLESREDNINELEDKAIETI